MNPDDLDLDIGSITIMPSGDYGIMTANGLTAMTSASATWTGNSTVSAVFDEQKILDKYEMNHIVASHKVSEHELLKLKEVSPTYTDEIKETLTKDTARDIVKKMTFTKRHDKDADVHHYNGRVWVFSTEELKNLIQDVRNA